MKRKHRTASDKPRVRPTLPKPPQCGKCGTTVASADVKLCSVCQGVEDAKAPSPIFRMDLAPRQASAVDGKDAGHPYRS